MPVKQRQQWDASDIAAHAMGATSLSQITLPEVKRMAASILSEASSAPTPKPEPARAMKLLRQIDDEREVP